MENEINKNSLVIDDTVYETQLTRKYRQRKPYTKPNPKMVHAVIPGVIREIYVKPGQQIKEGDKILMLEAMKMKNILASLRTGTVKQIKVEIGDMVYKGQVLMEID
jgi:biotin carboxyl carrier protein